MLFNSFPYIFIFLPIVVIIYYILLKYRLVFASKIWLVFSSIIFYSWWDPKYTTLLLLSMLVNFAIGSSFYAKIFQDKNKRKCLLIFGLVLNIAILGYFKYANFFIDNINHLFNCGITLAKIVLPLGISFFTFTQITYLVDTYKKEADEYSFVNYLLFVTFFPHLIAGPILHHKEIMPQFNDLKRKVLRYDNIAKGLFLFIIGLFKKVCIADILSLYVANGFGTNISILEAWIIMLSYTLQIYFDFSGYCDMALGSAKMLNIDLPVNFNSPYKAISVQDFWRRWHMTLSRFLRDYIYIPLGGSKKGEFKTHKNILITMLIAGLWHGASWMFVLWGAVHGLAQCIHKLYLKTKFQIPKAIAIIITFMFINFSWIIFRAENFNQAVKIYKALFNINNFIIPKTYHLDFVFANNQNNYTEILLVLPIAILIVFLCKNSNEIVGNININSQRKAVKYGIIFAVTFIFCILQLCISSYSEFIYFNF